MKKLLSLAVIALFAVSASAQYYLGGSLGFSSNSIDPDGGDKTTATSFSIAPEFGYKLDEKMSLGISVGFLTLKDFDNVGDEYKVTGWEVAPFFRYSLVEFGKFSLVGQAKVNVGGGKLTWEDYDDEEEYFNFGINITPMVTFDLSDKFTLLTHLNFANIGFNMDDYKDSHKVTNFGLGIDSNNVTKLGDITIGFLYNF